MRALQTIYNHITGAEPMTKKAANRQRRECKSIKALTLKGPKKGDYFEHVPSPADDRCENCDHYIDAHYVTLVDSDRKHPRYLGCCAAVKAGEICGCQALRLDEVSEKRAFVCHKCTCNVVMSVDDPHFDSRLCRVCREDTLDALKETGAVDEGDVLDDAAYAEATHHDVNTPLFGSKRRTSGPSVVNTPLATSDRRKYHSETDYNTYGYDYEDKDTCATGFTGGTRVIAGQYKFCSHSSMRHVLEIKGTKIYARSSGSYALGSRDPDLVLDCTATGPRDTTLPAEYECLRKHFYQAASVIHLPWTDGGSPPVMFTFWAALIEALPRNKTMIVTCMGGHGRTGTALACLYLAQYPDASADTAMAVIRTAHCKEAIETLTQEKHIEAFAAWNHERLGIVLKSKTVTPRKRKKPRQEVFSGKKRTRKSKGKGRRK